MAKSTLLLTALLVASGIVNAQQTRSLETIDIPGVTSNPAAQPPAPKAAKPVVAAPAVEMQPVKQVVTAQPAVEPSPRAAVKPAAPKAEPVTPPAVAEKPPVRKGGGVGVMAAPGTVVKQKPGGGQIVTTTIGGDGKDVGEQLAPVGFGMPTRSGVSAEPVNQPSIPEPMRDLLASPTFQQKLLAGAMANEKRRLEGAQANGQNAAPVAEPTALSVIPGVVEVVPISKGYLNRIVTPFENPRVYTINPIDTKVDANVVYVATDSDTPIGVYIQDNTEGADDTAISLSLTPQDIPPRELRLRLSGRSGGGGFASKNAEKWETGQPYVVTIKEVMKALALNQLPQGYSLSGPGNVPYRCDIPGFAMRLAQMVDGHNFRIAIYAVRNVSSYTREITEQACYRRGVAAVAAWPSAILEPNQETELYVAMKPNIEEEVKPTHTRPSVINSQR